MRKSARGVLQSVFCAILVLTMLFGAVGTSYAESPIALVDDVPSVQYYVHRQTYGWEKAWSKRDGAQSGTTGKSKRLEGIKVRIKGASVSGGITYRTHVQKIGWQAWKSSGTMSGTSGRSLRLEAIQIKLTGMLAKRYDVWYRVHAQKFGWMGWAKNGAKSGTAGYAYRLESIQIVLRPKGSAAPSSDYRGARRNTTAAFKEKKPSVQPSTPTPAPTPAYTPTPTPAPAEDNLVLITATGSRYHRLSGCRSTARASTTVVSLEYAQSLGLTPCANCYH